MHNCGSLERLQVEISAIDDLAIQKMECLGCHHSLDLIGLKKI